jgi:hypothetical protein
MNITDFAVQCYDLSQKELFRKCLELYAQIPKLTDLEEIKNSVTIEIEATENGYTKLMPYQWYLDCIKREIPDVVAILTKFPTELGLFTWEIVTVNERVVEHKMIKVWIVPSLQEYKNE